MSKFDEATVKQIIISGLQNEADHDTIKLEMFKSGVPFDKINAFFKSTAIEAGLMADPKVVREELSNAIDEEAVAELTSWDDVIEMAESLAAEVDGATRAMAIGALRNAAKDAEVAFPKKPKGGGARGFAGSKIKELIVDTLNSDPEIGSSALFALIYQQVGGKYALRNSLEYFNMYVPVMLAGIHRCKLSEVKLEALDRDALVKEYGGTLSYTAGKKSDEGLDDEDEEEDDDTEF